MYFVEYSGTWEEIWTQKGEMPGTKADIIEYDGWEKSSTSMEETANRISDFLSIKPDDRVLEIGCGAGGLGQYLNCNYIGIDFSKPLTKRCMEFFQLSAIHAEANDLPFKDAYFNKCFCWGVFLYFPSREYGNEVIAEIARVTKKSDQKSIFIGDIPVTSHNERHMTYSRKQFEDRGFSTIPGWADPYRDNRFNAWM